MAEPVKAAAVYLLKAKNKAMASTSSATAYTPNAFTINFYIFAVAEPIKITVFYSFAVAEPVEAAAVYLPKAKNKAMASTSSATAYTPNAFTINFYIFAVAEPVKITAIYSFAVAEPVEAAAVYLPKAKNKAMASTSSATAYTPN